MFFWHNTANQHKNETTPLAYGILCLAEVMNTLTTLEEVTGVALVFFLLFFFHFEKHFIFGPCAHFCSTAKTVQD